MRADPRTQTAIVGVLRYRPAGTPPLVLGIPRRLELARRLVRPRRLVRLRRLVRPRRRQRARGRLGLSKREPVIPRRLPATGPEAVSPLSRSLLRPAALHPGQPASVFVVHPDEAEINTCRTQSAFAVQRHVEEESSCPKSARGF